MSGPAAASPAAAGARASLRAADPRLWLAVLLFGASWLLPIRELPWVWFHADLLAAAALALLAAWLAAEGPARLGLPRAVALVLALAVVPLLQWQGGLIYYAGDAAMATLYLGGLAAAVACGHALARRQAGDARYAAATVLMLAVMVLVGLLCAAMALHQGLGSPWRWPGLLRAPDPSRATANLGQPNLLATLLLLALLAAVALHQMRRLGSAGLTAIAVALCAGLALTQSRTGWLALAVALVGFVALRRRAAWRAPPWAAALLGAVFVAAVLLRPLWLPTVGAPAGTAGAVSVLGGRPVVSTQEPEARLVHWATLASAIADRPWAGFGWNQVAVAQALAPRQGLSHEFIEHSHNLVLDLLVWNGVPLGGLLVLGLAGWLWRRGQGCRSAGQALLLLALGVLLTHAMTEYPLDFFGFLMLFGGLLGALDAAAPTGARPLLPRGLVLAGVAVLAVGVGWVAVEYTALERSHAAMRDAWTRRAWAAPAQPTPEVRLLTQLQALLLVMRVDLDRPVSDAQWTAMARLGQRYAYAPVLTRQAIAAERNGRPDDAVATLDRLCRTHHAPVCQRACQQFGAATTAARGQACMDRLQARWQGPNAY